MVCHRQKAAARSPQTGAWVFVCHSVCQLVVPELMLDTPYPLCIPTCSAGAVPPDAQTADFHIGNLHFKPAHRSKTIRPPFPIEKIPKNWNRSFQVKSLQAHGSGLRAPLPPQLFSLSPCKPLAFSHSALFSPQVAFPQYKEHSVLLRRPSSLGAPHIVRCFFLKKTSDKADALSLELPPIYSQIAAAKSSFHRNATTLSYRLPLTDRGPHIASAIPT